MQIKQAIVGTGSADKRQVIYMVRNVLQLDHDPRPDHAADALAAAVCHANLSRTKSVAYQNATSAMAEAERAQAEQRRLEALEVTAAATAANRARRQRSEARRS